MADAFAIAESIAAGRPPDSEAVAWLVSGLRRWARGEPLEAALGLNHSGRMRRRNVELRAAADALRAGRNVSDWDLAGELAARLQRFASGKLARYYRTGDVSTLDAVENRLLAAALSGAPTTNSKKNLFRIIERDPGQETVSLVSANSR